MIKQDDVLVCSNNKTVEDILTIGKHYTVVFVGSTHFTIENDRGNVMRFAHATDYLNQWTDYFITLRNGNLKSLLDKN